VAWSGECQLRDVVIGLTRHRHKPEFEPFNLISPPSLTLMMTLFREQEEVISCRTPQVLLG
jgi:hypothetical protein